MKIWIYLVLFCIIHNTLAQEDSIKQTKPEFPGGHSELSKYISSNFKLNQSAIDSQVKGSIYTRFIVKNDGSIDSITILKGLCCGLNEEAIRIIELMPKWTPATIAGMPVDMKMTLPIKVKIDTPIPEETKELTEELKERDTLGIIEKRPEFPGGTTALINFLEKNVHYPPDALENNAYGNVVVEFVIETDGSIQEARVLKSVYPSLDAEALRIIQIMPKWKPGLQHNKPVRVKYTLPIKFNKSL